MSKALLFSTSTCSWCRRAKRYFRERGVPFKEINIERDAAAARDIVRKTGQTGVPVIKIGSRWIVGFDKEQIDKELARKASWDLAVHAAKLGTQHHLQASSQCGEEPG